MRNNRPITRLLFLLLLAMLSACQSSGPRQFEAALEKFHSHDRAQAITEIRSLAEHGEVNSQAFLGSLYATGTGVARDLRQALAWQRKAAEQGQAMAQDLPEAARWFQQAANQGLPEAYLHLGLFHERGWVLRKCPYAASHQYYLAGHAFLEQHDFRGARLALQNIRRLLPHSELVDQLATEIYMYQ